MVGIPACARLVLGTSPRHSGLIVLGLRIADEEDMLKQQLDGYREYMQQVHFRLVPYVW